MSLEAKVLDILHEEEHAECERLGEGACVPVTCSCGERWRGAPEFRDAVVLARVTWSDGRVTSAYLDEPSFTCANDLDVRRWAGIIDVRIEGGY